MTGFHEKLNRTIERREFLCKSPPLCPECGTNQVQLVGYTGQPPAHWKCRMCKHPFTYEPRLPHVQT